MSRSAWARRCGRGAAVFGSALAAILLAGFFTMLGALALILPGIYLAVRLAFAGQAAAIERDRRAARAAHQHAAHQGPVLEPARHPGAGHVRRVRRRIGREAPFNAIGGTPELAATAIVQSAVNSSRRWC